MYWSWNGGEYHWASNNCFGEIPATKSIAFPLVSFSGPREGRGAEALEKEGQISGGGGAGGGWDSVFENTNQAKFEASRLDSSYSSMQPQSLLLNGLN